MIKILLNSQSRGFWKGFKCSFFREHRSRLCPSITVRKTSVCTSSRYKKAKVFLCKWNRAFFEPLSLNPIIKNTSSFGQKGAAGVWPFFCWQRWHSEWEFWIGLWKELAIAVLCLRSACLWIRWSISVCLYLHPISLTQSLSLWEMLLVWRDQS